MGIGRGSPWEKESTNLQQYLLGLKTSNGSLIKSAALERIGLNGSLQTHREASFFSLFFYLLFFLLIFLGLGYLVDWSHW